MEAWLHHLWLMAGNAITIAFVAPTKGTTTPASIQLGQGLGEWFGSSKLNQLGPRMSWYLWVQYLMGHFHIQTPSVGLVFATLNIPCFKVRSKFNDPLQNNFSWILKRRKFLSAFKMLPQLNQKSEIKFYTGWHLFMSNVGSQVGSSPDMIYW